MWVGPLNSVAIISGTAWHLLRSDAPMIAVRYTYRVQSAPCKPRADALYKRMTLDADEFIRRFLIHVLPDGFHRIRQHANEFNNL